MDFLHALLRQLVFHFYITRQCSSPAAEQGDEVIPLPSVWYQGLWYTIVHTSGL